MLVLLSFGVYCSLAGASMFGLCCLNNAYRAIDDFDFPLVSVLASVAFPIGFPIAAAYIIGTGNKLDDQGAA